VQFLMFASVVLVRILDPLTLLVAVAFACFAASRDSSEARWAIVGFGTILMVIALAALHHASSTEGGLPDGPFNGPSAVGASFLQIYLIMLAVRAWRNRRQRQNTS
jgi:hypothetical protein